MKVGQAVADGAVRRHQIDDVTVDYRLFFLTVANNFPSESARHMGASVAATEARLRMSRALRSHRHWLRTGVSEITEVIRFPQATTGS